MADPKMSMAAGRVYITGSDGTIRFDTDYRCLIATDYKSGTATSVLPSRSFTGGNGAAWETDFTIDTCNANATMVFGMFSLDGGTTWRPSAGSHILDLFYGNINNVGSVSSPQILRGIRMIYFKASGGNLIIHESTYLCPCSDAGSGTAQTYTASAQTIKYNLYAGTLT